MTIAVFGSANIDITATVGDLPAPGATIHATHHQIGLGGKGANQAIAANALYDGEVRFIGAVGTDPFGDMVSDALRHFGIGTKYLSIDKSNPTGLALIHVDATAQNTITVSGGANMAWPESGPGQAVFEGVKIVLFQLETPLVATLSALQQAQAEKCLTILDPAPVPDQDVSLLLQTADIITPNLTEAERLSGRPITGVEDAIRVAAQLRNTSTGTVIITLGEAGAVYAASTGEHDHVAAPEVTAVDTVAAGDCFNGALAAGIADNMPLGAAVRLAIAASALCVTKAGAAESMPDRATVQRLLASL